MKRKLERLIRKHGIIYVTILFGYNDTAAVKKWLERGIPELKKGMVKDVLNMNDNDVKNLILNTVKRRLDL